MNSFVFGDGIKGVADKTTIFGEIRREKDETRVEKRSEGRFSVTTLSNASAWNNSRNACTVNQLSFVPQRTQISSRRVTLAHAFPFAIPLSYLNPFSVNTVYHRCVTRDRRRGSPGWEREIHESGLRKARNARGIAEPGAGAWRGEGSFRDAVEGVFSEKRSRASQYSEYAACFILIDRDTDTGRMWTDIHHQNS